MLSWGLGEALGFLVSLGLKVLFRVEERAGEMARRSAVGREFELCQYGLPTLPGLRTRCGLVRLPFWEAELKVTSQLCLGLGNVRLSRAKNESLEWINEAQLTQGEAVRQDALRPLSTK